MDTKIREAAMETTGDVATSILGRTFEIQEGPLQGCKGVVISYMPPNRVKLHITLFQRTTVAEISLSALPQEDLPTTLRRERDPYDYIPEGMKLLEGTAYDLQCNPEYDLCIVPNYVWFDGWGYPSETLPDVRFIVNVTVAQVPVLFIYRDILEKVNALPSTRKAWEYVKFFPRSTRKNFFKRPQTHNVYFGSRGHGFDPKVFLEASEEFILHNEWSRLFEANRLVPPLPVFCAVPKINDDYLAIPLVHIEDYMKENVAIFRWGMFYDKMVDSPPPGTSPSL